MSYADYRFITNCRDIIQHGISDEDFEVRPKWADGTPAHTKKKLYVKDDYQLSPTIIPVMTLRKTGFKNAIDEILWIYQKKSNKISELHSHIWDDWNVGNGTIGTAYGYQIAKESKHHVYKFGENLHGLKYYIKSEADGKDYVYLSQIDAVIWDLLNNPGSRSIMTNTYNHDDLITMGLRPCAFMMVFNVTRESGVNYLNGTLVQRSQDMLTANNWNVVQYSILLQMLAQVTGMQPGKFSHYVFDMHIYDRHIPIVQEMIDKYHDLAITGEYYDVPYPNPTFQMNRDVKSFYDFTLDDFELVNYQYLPFDHKIEVAI